MPPRTRQGCIGSLVRLVLVVAVVGAVMLGVQWVLAPWAFSLGGTFRPIPLWQGVARVRASSGDYVLYLSMSPSPGGRSRLPNFGGWGSLCTPRGERFPLRFTASMLERPSRDTNGMEMHIDMYHRPASAWTGQWDRRPRLSLRGRWQNPDLVMSDGGSLSVAFLPDGRLYDGPVSQQPYARETLPVVIRELAWTTWFGDCRSLQ
jgi:hypothetical protein